MEKRIEKNFWKYIKLKINGGITMEKLLELLNSLKPGVDYAAQKKIADDGILDSLTLVRLIGLLEEEYDIEFEVTDLVPENFNSVEAMMAMIERLKD